MRRIIPLAAFALALLLGAEGPARLAASAEGAGIARMPWEEQARPRNPDREEREAKTPAQRQAERQAARQAERRERRREEAREAELRERAARDREARERDRRREDEARRRPDDRERRDRDRDRRRDDDDRRWREPSHGGDGWRHVDSRPHGWRPHRPTGWRPPYYSPPRWRSAHPYWGRYNYSPFWGWYFTAPLATTTLVYVDERPSAPTCEDVYVEGERMILCEGVLYRPATYRERTVYEIVSPEPEEEAERGATYEPERPARVLRLSSPFMRGPDVARLQEELASLGHLSGRPDGIFGPNTDRALRAFQRAQRLPETGAAEGETAFLLGL